MTEKLLMLITMMLFAAPHWTVQTSGVNVRLRGVSAVSESVAWASGAASTVLRTVDGGATWQKLTVTSDTLDFRDVDAVDAQTAYVLSIGNGPASRIYKTIDAGKTWTLQFKNEDPKVFLDAMSFWDADNGIVFGDLVDGQLYLLTTNDGGRVWSRVETRNLPPALENEGAFAASGTTSPSLENHTHGSAPAQPPKLACCALWIVDAPGKWRILLWPPDLLLESFQSPFAMQSMG